MTEYRCASGKRFEARLAGDSAYVSFGGDQGKSTLTRTTSASGSKYADQTTTLWIKGREAYVERDGQPVYFGCTAAR